MPKKRARPLSYYEKLVADWNVRKNFAVNNAHCQPRGADRTKMISLSRKWHKDRRSMPIVLADPARLAAYKARSAIVNIVPPKRARVDKRANKKKRTLRGLLGRYGRLLSRVRK